MTEHKHRQLPGNPASAIYGTIVTAGLLGTEGAGGHGVLRLVITVGVTLLVFWLAHAYTDLLGGVIEQGSRAETDLRHALRVEWPIVESGVLPLLALVIARAFGADVRASVLTALVTAVVEICAWAVLAGRRMELKPWPMAGFVCGSAALGAAIVVLKAVVH